jgi:hypothetical protein
MWASPNARMPARGKEVYPQNRRAEDPQGGHGRDDQATTNNQGAPYEDDVIHVPLTGACCGATAGTRTPLCHAGRMSQDREYTTGVRPVVAWDRTNGEPHSSGGIDP